MPAELDPDYLQRRAGVFERERFGQQAAAGVQYGVAVIERCAPQRVKPDDVKNSINERELHEA